MSVTSGAAAAAVPQPGRLKAWVLGARPKTLVATVAPILVASSLAAAIQGGLPRWGLSVLALLSTLFIQIGTNLFNDAIDYERGADTAERLGPTRVTQSGLLPPRAVWWGGALAFAIAALLGIPLLLAGGTPILWIGVFSLAAGYLYTGGPKPLAYTGLGDLFVLIFFGWVAVAGLVLVHLGGVDPRALWAGTQVGLLATSLIAINNLRDHVGDRKADKRTLAVRFGPRFVKTEIALLLLIPYALGARWVQEGWSWAFVLPFAALPLALRLARDVMRTEPGRAYNGFLARASLTQLLFCALLSLGFWLA